MTTYKGGFCTEGPPSGGPTPRAVVDRVSDISHELPAEHHRIFLRALSRITSLEHADITFAQLVDGLPTWRVARERRAPHSGVTGHRDHPLRKHTELCPDAMERMLAFKSTFDPDALPFDVRLIREYGLAAVGSRAFKVRLIELMANAIHQIGVYIYKNVESPHNKEQLECWKPPPRRVELIRPGGPIELRDWPYEPFPTFFSVDYYRWHEKYPDGLADVVGYWAEDCILGGITLFDRGESGIECNDVWWHSASKKATFRICRLTDEQLQSLMDLCFSDSEPLTSPLPILPTLENRDRHDPYVAINFHNIFRERWERRPAARRRPRCVIDSFDYPEVKVHLDAIMSTYHAPVYTVEEEERSRLQREANREDVRIKIEEARRLRLAEEKRMRDLGIDETWY
ncbi:hypothetical protein QBC46DRAFT_393850 [Diplogelasinospora grovesii]|uniref:Uncharacterized protein n=1 Tax=Diplogelasinospora grovesii TaxID=303347 RepID=A0AAN6N358_9PEZI|nr:hypothetical protein QBC46DRAFT_393850 [Diplogelasinospora grovesii]